MILEGFFWLVSKEDARSTMAKFPSLRFHLTEEEGILRSDLRPKCFCRPTAVFACPDCIAGMNAAGGPLIRPRAECSSCGGFGTLDAKETVRRIRAAATDEVVETIVLWIHRLERPRRGASTEIGDDQWQRLRTALRDHGFERQSSRSTGTN